MGSTKGVEYVEAPRTHDRRHTAQCSVRRAVAQSVGLSVLAMRRLSVLQRSACIAAAGAIGGLSLGQALRAEESNADRSNKEGIVSFQRMAPQRRPSTGEDWMELSKTRPVLVGIAGGTGSGKTTVASAIAERIGDDQLVHICHDSYYKPLDHLSISER